MSAQCILGVFLVVCTWNVPYPCFIIPNKKCLSSPKSPCHSGHSSFGIFVIKMDRDLLRCNTRYARNSETIRLIV